MKREILSSSAPASVGPYSQAVIASGLVFCSGQLGIDPKTGKLVHSSIGDETRQAMQNLKAVLEAARSTLKRVVKVTIYTTCMLDFKEINDAYKTFFLEQPPCRSAVGVAQLSIGARVEIDAIAVLE